MRYLYFILSLIFFLGCSPKSDRVIGKSREQIFAIMGMPISTSTVSHSEILEYKTGTIQILNGKGLAEIKELTDEKKNLSWWLTKWKVQDLLFSKKELGEHGEVIRLEIYNKKERTALIYNINTNKVENEVTYDAF